MSPPEDLLHRPCPEAVAQLAFARLAEAEAAAMRLEDESDAQALHDFRVAIRRLRSLAKAWRPELRGRIGKRDRQALRSLQAATSEGRDAEVALGWLERQREALSEAELPGLDWLTARLDERLGSAMAHAREGVRTAFAARDEQLRADLGRKSKAKGKSRSYRRSVERALAEHHDAVRELLTGAESPHEEERLHQARIAVKRLRYLTEPLRPQLKPAAGVVKACKRLQDLLGDINDAHVQQGEIASRLEELRDGEQAATLSPGLQALHGLAGSRLGELHAALDRDWLGQDLRQLREPVCELLETLARGQD
jgi:CHAD domain-containing protein